MASWLDAYREEIQACKGKGEKQTDMIRMLRERYGVEVKPQTLSDYMRKLGEDGAGPAVLPRQADMEMALLHAAVAEVVERMAQVIEGLQQVKREGDEHHAAMAAMLQGLRFQDTIDRHTLAFQALYKQFMGEVMLRIWLKALAVCGAAWGAAWWWLR